MELASRIRAGLATALLFTAGCRSAEMAYDFVPSEEYDTIEVFYGTNRARVLQSAPGERFGGTATDDISRGVCYVSIPKDHRMAEIERPSVFELEFREDPEKHVVLLAVDHWPERWFHEAARDRVEAAEKKELFVFVHGFNVTFEAAAWRAAQLKYDLEFKGLACMFSWPSKGELLAYEDDGRAAAGSFSELSTFLEGLVRETGVERVYLVAHSMGNRVLTRAFGDLAKRLPEDVQRVVKEVILTAPDIDAKVFEDEIAPAIVGKGPRVTLYASSKDRALQASAKKNDGPRAGDSGSGNVVVVPGIETIDVSAVSTSFLGHSYYGDNESVVSDLRALISGEGGAGARYNLARKRKRPREPEPPEPEQPGAPNLYWSFSP